MIYCPNCGTSLPDDSAFCESCGTAIPQSTAYEAPAYEYAAPAYPSAVRTPAAPVWIVAVAMLVGMLFLRFAFNFIWAQIPYPESSVGNVLVNNLRTVLTYAIIFGASMGGIAICNAACRSRGQWELALPLTDAFIPFGCWIICTLLNSMAPMLFHVLGLSTTVITGTLVWLVIALGAAAGAYFLLRSASKSRQKALASQTQW